VQENEAKENARVPLHPARRRRGRRVSELASLRQADTLFPPPSPMLGAGQRGKTFIIGLAVQIDDQQPPTGA
jgi:hypothetical protein